VKSMRPRVPGADRRRRCTREGLAEPRPASPCCGNTGRAAPGSARPVGRPGDAAPCGLTDLEVARPPVRFGLHAPIRCGVAGLPPRQRPPSGTGAATPSTPRREGSPPTHPGIRGRPGSPGRRPASRVESQRSGRALAGRRRARQMRLGLGKRKDSWCPLESVGPVPDVPDLTEDVASGTLRQTSTRGLTVSARGARL
jgi:hypothetical protein